MAEKDSNIPTLTSVIQQGDPEMLDHFDMQKQNHQQSTVTPTVENASSYENEDAEEILSLRLDDEEVELPQQDFSEAMQQRLVEIDKQPKATSVSNVNDTNVESIRQSIDDAITEVIPQIEEHLRKTLYKKFGA